MYSGSSEQRSESYAKNSGEHPYQQQDHHTPVVICEELSPKQRIRFGGSMSIIQETDEFEDETAK